MQVERIAVSCSTKSKISVLQGMKVLLGKDRKINDLSLPEQAPGGSPNIDAVQ